MRRQENIRIAVYELVCAGTETAKPSTESPTLKEHHYLSKTNWFREERVIRDFEIRFIGSLGP
jgi:hypothetical protein